MELEAAELDACRRFDDRLRHAQQEDVELLTVARAELLARQHQLAILAVANEHTAFDGSEEHAAVRAVVNRHLCRVVKHVYVCVLKI